MSRVYARTLAKIGIFITIAKFDGFVHTSGCTGRYSGTVSTYMRYYTPNRDIKSNKDIPFSV